MRFLEDNIFTTPTWLIKKEVFEKTGQKIFIYQTDNFLKFSGIRNNSEISDQTYAEIRSIKDKVPRSSVVKVIDHTQITSTENGETGVLYVELKRPLNFFTASGSFLFELDNVSQFDVELVDYPDGTPEEYKVWAGVGINYNFNIHVRSHSKEQNLPVGYYVFRCSAKNNQKIDLSDLFE